MDKLNTCADIIDCLEKTSFNLKAFNTRSQQGWISLSTQDFLDAVKFVTLGLKDIGLQHGDRVGILANPSTEWTIVDLAIMVAGGVAVPLFANISDENFVYEAKETELEILFIEGKEQWEMFHRHSNLFKIGVALGEIPTGEKIMTFSDLKEKGKLIDNAHSDRYQKLKETLKPSDLAAIIYTSGSTGIPKGAELTHQNLTCTLNFGKFNWSSTKDRYLSVLPLAHVFGHCLNLWVLAWGASIFYSTDYKNLALICQEVKPTATAVVPRLLEKIYAKIHEQVNAGKGIKGAIGKWAFSLAKCKNPSLIQKLMNPIANFLVYGKFRNSLGGKLRVVISGGAPLNPELQYFFDHVGIPIYEGWGMTEACPVSVNTPNSHKAGSVGNILEGQEVRINPDGEILVKGSLVMRGYYRHAAESTQTLDKDKWLHTGDRGVLDQDGFLTILGRMKELYKTSTGEYVAPVPIEQALSRHPLIDMSMVIAEGRKFTSCLLFPNFDVLRRMKTLNKASTQDDEKFLNGDSIQKEIDKFIREINKHLNHWEEIHAYRFILDPLTIQNGELTPSMKIRREVVAKKYSPLIDDMYKESK